MRCRAAAGVAARNRDADRTRSARSSSIGAFIVHVYMGVLVVPGSVDAILRGEVSDEWARHHHRLWADDVAARRTPARNVDRVR